MDRIFFKELCLFHAISAYPSSEILEVQRQFVPIDGRKFNLDGRIVGGEEARIENHPYQVAVFYQGNQICGGAVLSTKAVLSAAHCTL